MSEAVRQRHCSIGPCNMHAVRGYKYPVEVCRIGRERRAAADCSASPRRQGATTPRPATGTHRIRGSAPWRTRRHPTRQWQRPTLRPGGRTRMTRHGTGGGTAPGLHQGCRADAGRGGLSGLRSSSPWHRMVAAPQRLNSEAAPWQRRGECCRTATAVFASAVQNRTEPNQTKPTRRKQRRGDTPIPRRQIAVTAVAVPRHALPAQPAAREP